MNVSEIVALLGAAVLIYKAITLTPVDRSLTEATVLEKMEGVANRAVERGLKLEDKIVKLQKDADDAAEKAKSDAILHAQELRVRDDRISALEIEMGKIKDWAERLVYQIKALGAEPVPMIPKARKKVAKAKAV